MKLRFGVVSRTINSSISPNFTLRFNGQSYTHRFLFQGFKGLQRWVHSSFLSEDDFSDLGPPVIQGVNTRLKLVTEKHEFFKQSKDDSGNSTATKPDMKMIPSAKSLLMNLEKSSHPQPKIEKPKNARPKIEKPENISITTSNSKCNSNIKNSSSISVEGVPSAVNMSKLVEAVSGFGKISSAYMKNVANGLDCCVVKYQNEESSSRAISAGKITIGSFHLPIRPLHVPKSVTIRIKDIGKDTAYTAVHSICKAIGELVGMVKATENSIDALFSLKEYSETQNILAELNNKIVDDCQWSAHLLAKPSSPKVMSKNEISQLGLQVSNRLTELKNEVSTRKIYAEDLEYMHMAIMHLEEQHTVDSGSTTN